MYRNFFTSAFIPDASPAEAESFDELQRVSTSPENAVRILNMNGNMDVTENAKQVRTPTLVLHIKGDHVAPVSEGRLLARLIPGATFVELPGNNHAMTPGQASFDQFFEEVRSFLARHGSSGSASSSGG